MANVKSFTNKVAQQFKAKGEAIAKIEKEADRVRKFRAEASRKASLANKRIKRLEEKGFTDAPAYKQYLAEGAKPFGVRGKNYRQVQTEMARLDRLIASETSTVRGATKNIMEMAKNIGINMKHVTLKEAQAQGRKFFQIKSMIDQLLTHIYDAGAAFGYQQIFDAINVYVKDARLDLNDLEQTLEDIAESVAKALTSYEKKIPLPSGEWYQLKKDN